MTNQNFKHVLSNYLAVMANQQLSMCKVASMVEAHDSGDVYYLWEEHERLRNDFRRIYGESSTLILQDVVNNVEKVNNVEFKKLKPSFSYLDLKVKIAERMFQHCNFAKKHVE